jgi:small subunit ribosomal protein S9
MMPSTATPTTVAPTYHLIKYTGVRENAARSFPVSSSSFNVTTDNNPLSDYAVGNGSITINHIPFDVYFERLTDRAKVLEPLVVTETVGWFDVQEKVHGGGLTGQAGAIRQGLARALNRYNPDLYRPVLKRTGMLTRDARKVERKKIGHKKARKSPQ